MITTNVHNTKANITYRMCPFQSEGFLEDNLLQEAGTC